MKWNVKKASRVFDSIIGFAIAYFLVELIWVDGSIDSDLIVPIYVGIVAVIAYRTGFRSGRKIERMMTKDSDDG